MTENTVYISAGDARRAIGELFGEEYARRLVANASDCIHGLIVPLTPFETIEYDRTTGTWARIERGLS